MAKAMSKFMLPFSADYANKDEHFVSFITKDAHKYFELLE